MPWTASNLRGDQSQSCWQKLFESSEVVACFFWVEQVHWVRSICWSYACFEGTDSDTAKLRAQKGIIAAENQKKCNSALRHYMGTMLPIVGGLWLRLIPIQIPIWTQTRHRHRWRSLTRVFQSNLVRIGVTGQIFTPPKPLGGQNTYLKGFEKFARQRIYPEWNKIF